jgi:hypothetical protein
MTGEVLATISLLMLTSEKVTLARIETSLSGLKYRQLLKRSGRDGQIRTADLSLRRRPLYPSELRPRTNFLIVASEALGSNIAPVMHVVKVDQRDCGIRALNC